MKKHTCLLAFIFLTFFDFRVFAGTTTLTTFYPAPTGAYNTVKMATNYVSSTVTSTASCTNSSTIFKNTATGTLYQCTGTGTASAYCTAANQGNIIVDSTGTLHVCMYNSSSSSYLDTIFPQQCYNVFCGYDSSVYTLAASSCAAYATQTANTQGLCPNGFNQIAVDGIGNTYDQFQTSPSNKTVSIVCCSQ